jgi:hypothetical protein
MHTLGQTNREFQMLALVKLLPESMRIDVSRRSKNGFNSLFLDALATGGDCVAGAFPMKFMYVTGHRTIPLVKSASSEFYQRVKTYALFTCTQGRELDAVCNDVVTSGERRDFTVQVIVTATAEFGDEPVARISQAMSLKNLSAK